MEPTRGRGRPKKEDAMSAAERARRYRKNQKAAGLIKRYVTENTDTSATEDISFWIADDKLAYARVVIVDEASMLTKWALDHLARMCDTLILVGDGNQLPPVGDKDVPRGLFCTRQHDATLTEVLRNDGAVLKLADAVRTSRDGRDLAGIDLDDYSPADDFEMLLVLDRPQLICWRNVIRKAVNARARRTLGFEGVLPLPGDLMICRDNSDDVLLNGTQATMLDFSWDKRNRLANIVLDVAGCEGDHSAQMDMFRFFQDQLPACAGILMSTR